MLRRVVITGLGAVSPNGIGLKTFWENTCNGISGIDRITSFDPSALACQIAGEVTQFDPSIYFSAADLKKLPRSIPLAVAATQEALAHAGIDLPCRGPKHSVVWDSVLDPSYLFQPFVSYRTSA